jgi:WXXGXW repeat (2 copies)
MRNLCLRVVFLALAVLVVSAGSSAQIGIGVSVSFGPPALPVYDQPVCPGDGYIWTPGYWAWNGFDYYWVPGTWVLAPEVGYLWTPPWWGWDHGAFFFHEGFWGPHVGFYGGINYGFGYFGTGFMGGRWDGGHFFYNRSVMNVNVVNVHNVYNETVINRNVTINHISYNGGEGGIVAHPTPEEDSYGRERHIGPVEAQNNHLEAARNNPELRASSNHGRPPIAATAHPGEFRGEGAVGARDAGGAYNPPANRERTGGEGGGNFTHAKDLPPLQHLPAPNTGDRNLDQKYQQQQDRLFAKQNNERQNLQQRQEREDQQMQRNNASQDRRQQTEQRHQQQTQQMQQRHQQQQQRMTQRQAPRGKR